MFYNPYQCYCLRTICKRLALKFHPIDYVYEIQYNKSAKTVLTNTCILTHWCVLHFPGQHNSYNRWQYLSLMISLSKEES